MNLSNLGSFFTTAAADVTAVADASAGVLVSLSGTAAAIIQAALGAVVTAVAISSLSFDALHVVAIPAGMIIAGLSLHGLLAHVSKTNSNTRVLASTSTPQTPAA